MNSACRCATVFFHNWDQMKETGKFFAIGEDGEIANTPAGALITKLSVAFYPEEQAAAVGAAELKTDRGRATLDWDERAQSFRG